MARSLERIGTVAVAPHWIRRRGLPLGRLRGGGAGRDATLAVRLRDRLGRRRRLWTCGPERSLLSRIAERGGPIARRHDTRDRALSEERGTLNRTEAIRQIRRILLLAASKRSVSRSAAQRSLPLALGEPSRDPGDLPALSALRPDRALAQGRLWH